MSVEKKKFECSALPKGWQREEVIRKSGISAGKVDVYYYSPNGKKFRSKPQLARYLGDALDLATFDFRSGKINSLLLRKNKKQRGTQFDYSRGVRNDASLVPPIRQTASIFKQPVTVYKTQEGKVKADFKHGAQEKPKQLFWEKRLEGLRACDLDGFEFDAMELPRALRAVGPHVGEETLLQSVATALHVSTQPVTGQTGSRSALEKNPGVFLNPDQPLVQAVAVADEDIKRQEERVATARKKLQDALKRFVA
ncbi:hypothetical protein R5R35_010423 [Gryllus longicercus]|uniref:MBD domain-containing protein n=1 Tax=Gryllus longicercus TaxID=2509291 RepID=A0AAN9Z3B3_9ORTH